MSGTEVQILIFVFIAFAMGVLIGIVAIASYAYRHEDQLLSLPSRAPDAVCQGARRLTGVGTIGPAGWVIPGQRPGTEDAPLTGARR